MRYEPNRMVRRTSSLLSAYLLGPGVLSENNVLRIVAKEADHFDFDNFIIDNVVIVFKTL